MNIVGETEDEATYLERWFSLSHCHNFVFRKQVDKRRQWYLNHTSMKGTGVTEVVCWSAICLSRVVGEPQECENVAGINLYLL